MLPEFSEFSGKLETIVVSTVGFYPPILDLGVVCTGKIGWISVGSLPHSIPSMSAN